MNALPDNRSMPQCAVIPVLGYADVRAASTWLCEAFGFAERLRIGAHRVQLVFAGGAIVVTAQAEEPGRGEVVMVRVPDVQGHCARARRCGALILGEPTDHVYGERQYTAEDPGGRVWTFSQTLADVDPGTWGGELLTVPDYV